LNCEKIISYSNLLTYNLVILHGLGAEMSYYLIIIILLWINMMEQQQTI